VIAKLSEMNRAGALCIVKNTVAQQHSVYGRHRELVDRYKISISQTEMNFFPCTYIDVFLASIIEKTFIGLDDE